MMRAACLKALSSTGNLRPRNWLSGLPAPVLYAITLGLAKAVSLLTLPLVAAFLPPSEYGKYDVAVSVVELVGIVMGLAAGATLVRFATTAPSEAEAGQRAGELLGSAICVVGIVGALVIAAAPLLTASLGIETHPIAFRLLVAAAVFSPCIELPLVWMRIKDRALDYLGLAVFRIASQLAATVVPLWLGFGVDGLMAGNGLVMLFWAVFLTAMVAREVGLSVSWQGVMRIASYGLPLVGAALALFVLGNANRFFMPGVVTTDVIAQFGLASRIAGLIWLMLLPFDMWWGPRRISVLTQAGGLELGARMWGISVALMLLGAVGLALVGPLGIRLLLPPGYWAVTEFLGPLLVAQFLHLLVGITNVGSYARETGYRVLAIDSLGAAVGLIGYCLLVPRFFAYGAIMAMILGTLVRFALHVGLGAKLAPLPYPWVAAALCGAVAMALVWFAPGADQFAMWRLAYACCAATVLSAVVFVSGLVPRSFDQLNVQR